MEYRVDAKRYRDKGDPIDRTFVEIDRSLRNVGFASGPTELLERLLELTLASGESYDKGLLVNPSGRPWGSVHEPRVHLSIRTLSFGADRRLVWCRFADAATRRHRIQAILGRDQAWTRQEQRQRADYDYVRCYRVLSLAAATADLPGVPIVGGPRRRELVPCPALSFKIDVVGPITIWGIETVREITWRGDREAREIKAWSADGVTVRYSARRFKRSGELIWRPDDR